MPAKAGIQYAAAYRFHHCCLWDWITRVRGDVRAEIALARQANQFAVRREGKATCRAVAQRAEAHHQATRSMIDGGHVANATLPTLRIQIRDQVTQRPG